jgi:hypothetical protein
MALVDESYFFKKKKHISPFISFVATHWYLRN